MTRYLGSLGHQRIAFVTGHKDHKAVLNRYLGYRDGLRSMGLKFDRRLVRSGDNSFESGVRCARGLLELPDPPTAIFASNDDMAAGVMQVAHEAGLSIPGDLSVAGFDDVPLASYIWPSLTTIRQPIEEMAVRATASAHPQEHPPARGREPQPVRQRGDAPAIAAEGDRSLTPSRQAHGPATGAMPGILHLQTVA
jgi:LacI family transcriptional regulator